MLKSIKSQRIEETIRCCCLNGSIEVLVECKAPKVKITQATFDQIAIQYDNECEILMVTNGLNHYFCQMDFENEKYLFLNQLPEYNL
jgi:hypothetical protein